MNKKEASKNSLARLSSQSLDLKMACSKIETLENVVAEKENLIDNLMLRAGELESNLVKKDSDVAALKNEIAQLNTHISSLDKAICQRDEHVANLEIKTTKTLDLFSKNNSIEEQINEFTKATLANHSKIEEHLAFLARNEQNNLVLGKVNHVIESTSDQHSQVISRLENDHNLASELAHTLDKLQPLTIDLENTCNQLLQKRESEEAQSLQSEIEQLTENLSQRDQWGENTQKRLLEVNRELTELKGTIAWRLSSKLKLAPRAAKLILKFILKTAMRPYKALTKFGWRIAPNLFHKLYHTKLMARFYQQKPTPNTAKVIEESQAPLIVEDNDVRTENLKVNDFTLRRWNTGKRLDRLTR